MNSAGLVAALTAGALVTAGAYWLGYDHGADRYRHLVAQHAAQAEEALAQAERAAELLDGAMQALGLTEKRVVEVLRKKTGGRACLDPDAVRVLNDLRAGRPVESPDAGDSAGPRAAATDTDIAVADAQAVIAYEGCRAQLATARRALGALE